MQIKHLFFLVPIWRFQHFKYILQNQKLKQMATGFSYHSLDLYMSKSLGPLILNSFAVEFFLGGVKQNLNWRSSFYFGIFLSSIQ